MSNTIIIRGNLVEDWELRFSGNGNAWATTRVVSSRPVKVDDKWEEKDKTFFHVKVFGKQAENIAESVLKGDPVTIVGRVVQENWETESGDKRSKLVVMCDEVAATIRHHQVKVQRMSRDKGDGNRGGSKPAGAKKAAPANDPWAV